MCSGRAVGGSGVAVFGGSVHHPVLGECDAAVCWEWWVYLPVVVRIPHCKIANSNHNPGVTMIVFKEL